MRSTFALPFAFAISALVSVSAPCFADDAPKPVAAPPAVNDGSQKRAVPDYDNRATPPQPTATDVLLWVPRSLLLPAYDVNEYALRRPLGWFVTKAEQDEWQVALENFFTFGPDHKIGLVPTALIDFGLKPSVGVYGFWDDFGTKGNNLRLQFGTWGPDWLQLSLTDRIFVGDSDATMALIGSYTHRPDFPFFGIGPRSLQKNESRFAETSFEAALEYHVPLGSYDAIVSRAGVRHDAYGPGGAFGDPSTTEQIDAGVFPTPPGFVSGFSIGYQRVEVDLDTRQKRPASQTGVRFEADEETDFDLKANPGDSWIQWGGTLGGYLDLSRARVLALKVSARFSDPMKGQDPIPFTELVSLGGNTLMTGYLRGRLIDRSAAVLEVEYRWPIWVFLDGTLQAQLGNVFDEHLDDFATKLLRLSTGIGVRTNGSPDHALQLLTGFGTETFADGLKVDSFRLVIGGTRGF